MPTEFALYLTSTVVIGGVGAGVLLFERFTPSSRRFLLVTTILASWLLPLGFSHLAEPASVDLWLRLAFVGIPLTIPAIYYMAASISPHRQRPGPGVIWLVGGMWSGLNVVSPVLLDGLRSLCTEYTLGSGGWLAATYLGYESVVIGVTVHHLLRSRRSALSGADARERLVVTGAAALGSLTLLDYAFAADPFRAGWITPVALSLGAAAIGAAAMRYRFFAPGQSFATDEVLSAMADAVLVCDRDGLIRGSNAACHRLLGRSEGWLHGRALQEVLRPRPGTDDTGWHPDPEETTTAALELVPRESAPIPVSATLRPLFHGRRSAGVVVVARDERERLRAERAREEAQLRYQALHHHHPAVVHECDEAGRILALNPAGRRILGLENDAPIDGLSWTDCMHPDDVPEATRTFQRVLEGTPQEYGIRLQCCSGKGYRTIRGALVPVQDGARMVGVIGIGLDVTEEIETKRALEIQRRYFATLFDGSPEAIVLVGTDDRVARVNGEFTRMFGYTSDEAVGRSLSDLIVPDDLSDEGRILSATAVRGEVVREESVRKRKDGSRLHVSLLARKLALPGEPDQLYGIYRDISERKDTERLLRSKEEELRHAQKLEAVGILAGGIAHDFNNLLTVINGCAQYALDTVAPDSEVREDLHEIDKAGRRAASLTQQLLAFSRRQVLRPQVLSPNSIIRELEGMLGRLIGEHIRVVARLAELGDRVRVDRGQLEQVLVNLVVNARDAMPDGGTVFIETDAVELAPSDPRVVGWEMTPGRYVRIRIRDTGPGMDEETLSRAFEPFFTTKEQGKGTGLGLSTVFGILKQSGGHAALSSVQGEGTVCDVFVPTAESSDAQEATASEGRGSGPTPPGAGGTILVVEDEDAVRHLAVRVLERRGYDVLAAENGAQALEVIRHHAEGLDLVVTDLVMPEMGGRQLVEALRAGGITTPVILMSGYDEGLVAEVQDSADFLAKPFTPSALADRVARALAGDAAPAGVGAGA